MFTANPDLKAIFTIWDKSTANARFHETGARQADVASKDTIG